MAKIYGNPITLGGGGGQNADLPPLLDNFKASVPVECIPVKNMPVGTKIKVPVNTDCQSFLGKNITWMVIDHAHTGYPQNYTTLRTEKIIACLSFDAREPENTDSNRRSNGNNNYFVSNIDRWLNSDKPAGHWWSKSHTYDSAPTIENVSHNPYKDKSGFLAMLNSKFVNIILETPIKYKQPDVDSGGLVTSGRKVFLLSETELGGTSNGEGYKFSIYTDDESRKHYPTQEAYDNSAYKGSEFATNKPWYVWTRTQDSSNSSYVCRIFIQGNIDFNTAKAGTHGIVPVCNISSDTLLNAEPDSDGCYTLAELAPVTIVESDDYSVTLSADKMEESRAKELAGAVWVYADHEPESVNDGTKIQLTREEVVTSDGGEAQTVTKTVEWNNEANFFARQFTYNSKKQYQTMLEGAIVALVLTGIPDPVTELAEQHSGSSITLTWKNPTSDEFYDHTVVVYKTGAFPTAIDDGTQGYSGTDETATLSGLEPGSTYYIAVFTVSAYGLYGEPQTVQVEIPAGRLLSSLASGTKVKLGQWNNTDLQWKVARDASDQSIRLVLEPTSVSLLGNKMWDNKEPSNSDSNRRSYGNNRYIYSNIHQWLNATKATDWYTAQHSTDAAPDYSSQAGFLSGWSENHIAALDRATLTVSRSSTDGGGTETFVSRVALMSTTELGLESGTGNGRLVIFNSDGDRATGSVYWTRTPYPSNSYGVGRVSTAGTLRMNYYASNAYGVRPLCSPVSTALVSPEKDDDNCYVVQ